ncbi:MAG: hypothetical protein UR60_C0047G0015 [Candidatus Moranbacteria bacterium GW2011_GWF2_34_56]|nr:MAG: hypothetical protein UR51_C0009G0002 [Candidatus Moranbacteria bacterium GW2011_GWF1_34_10]KKP63275.1 MAG: hypothetical protein UR60_C0047G0015 [Candidatus Moranbacteria bacterium GW2011_GWF2_34_56]HBI17556.1 hypothetical protein [Candidatus Moranbacteria bacterium]
MAQLISSLKTYLIDFFRRNYNWKEYLVKAERNSPVEHNFRECPNPECQNLIASLDPHCPEQKCSKCKQILHREGKYEDGKRTFILRRPLNEKLFGISFMVFIVSLFLGIIIFRIVPIPDGYIKIKPAFITHLWCAVNIILFCSGFFCLMLGDLIGAIARKWKSLDFAAGITILPFATLVGAAFVLGIYEIKGYSAVPFWVDVPTQEEVYNLQKQEVDQMSPTPARYDKAKEYSSNPQISLAEEFLLIAENDFPGLMKKYAINIKAFKRGSDEEARLYKAYLSYLNFLKAMDLHAFQNQCIADPWNMITAGSASAYPEIATICK